MGLRSGPPLPGHFAASIQGGDNDRHHHGSTCKRPRNEEEMRRRKRNFASPAMFPKAAAMLLLLAAAAAMGPREAEGKALAQNKANFRRDPETVYVDRQLLNDLGNWLGNLKDEQLNRIMFNLKQRRRKQHHRLLSLQAGAGAAQGGPARIRRPPTTNNFRSRHRKLRMQQRQQQQQQQRQPLFPPPPPQVGSTRRPLDFLREQTLGRYQSEWTSPSSTLLQGGEGLEVDISDIARPPPRLKPSPPFAESSLSATEAYANSQLPRPRSTKTTRTPTQPKITHNRQQWKKPLTVWDFSLI